MSEIIKKLFNKLRKQYSLRRYMVWVATKIRQNQRLRRFFKNLNLLSNPWVVEADEFDEHRRRYSIDFKALLQSPIPGPICLVALGTDNECESFIAACKLLGAEYELLDPTRSDFIDQVKRSQAAFFVSRPNHSTALQREIFLEKETVLRRYMGKRVFPTLIENEIYESKRILAYFLESNNLPHPKTFITYTRNEALEFIENCTFPQVFKSKNGAGSTGVEIVYTKKEGRELVEVLFDSHYVNKALSDYRDIDYGYIYFQEYIPEVREFRVIKIGESWFGHEKAKLADQEFMSGSGVNYWTPPSLSLLNFCEAIATRFDFITMCFDVFQDNRGQYLINEMQTWFGSYNPSQMYIDGVPGRYRKNNGEWRFEEGLFNDIQSAPLRLLAYINKFE